MNLSKILIISVISLATLGSARNTLIALTSDVVDADVKINLCGDGFAEGIEECDQGDLRGFTCQNMGYAYGNLSCDNSCSLILNCVSSSPTPVVPTPTFLPDVTSTDIPIIPTQVSRPDTTTDTTDILSLPGILSFFDMDNDGKLLFSELKDALSYWVQKWSLVTGRLDFLESDLEECDIDGDKKCNLVDFSIILYYGEQ